MLMRFGILVLLATGCIGDGQSDGVNPAAFSGEVVDGVPTDSTPVDSAAQDSGANDSAGDTGIGDSGHSDSAGVHSGTDDSATLDSGTVDTGEPSDSGDTGTIDEDIPAGDWIDIDAGAQYSCGVHADGTAECWGTSEGYDVGQLTPPTDVAFADIEVSAYLTCGLDAAGLINCFGHNHFGEGAPPVGAFAELAVTYGNYASAADSAGMLTSWGDCTGGGTTECTDPPEGPLTSVSGLVATCGIAADGTITCWGPVTDSILPPPAGVWSSVAVGDTVACALDTAGEATCWGADVYPDYWGGTWPEDYVSQTPAGPFTTIGAGGSLACALHEDGTPECWGYFGSSAATPSYPLTKLSVGQFHSCGISELGGAVCWGYDTSGETVVP